jgi:hypothetical protein
MTLLPPMQVRGGTKTQATVKHNSSLENPKKRGGGIGIFLRDPGVLKRRRK